MHWRQYYIQGSLSSLYGKSGSNTERAETKLSLLDASVPCKSVVGAASSLIYPAIKPPTSLSLLTTRVDETRMS